MKRGFEKVSSYAAQDIKLPQRATQNAAGYDFFAAKDFVLPSIWKKNFIKVLAALRKGQTINEDEMANAQKILKPYLVPTGIKAYMGDDEYLLLADRSSAPLKRGLVLPNGVGIIDADYYNNDSNEGEIFFQLLNFSLFDQTIKQGEKLGQGIFMPYLTADGEERPQTKRTGGFGSSGR
ncbi:deoxyuridine 5-triphosphate nucleotidohydrolase [Ligilactobacillus acidipiscis DSM 15836]|uniref:dUTP diphosphatase n=2 Tax=Ligilactobacillus acidipiscis TaxID=89059 RepID=A0A921K1C0_9LACO|nr:dUTP diphosphatase [Ligilactobacillus acidipiscis]KRM23266.1 deoxyuridine 5-triphosphate nucleotidohydrolase [Ligilactobacillus acidipiscis DSM 15836]WEV56296.1 dUTP diphosphatase [Ligilactobacillus acidipiscis]GAW64327.1 deoxyuridine 5'-triphosphate nucleotidohydrolase [Ligilactobacillus acidipiscis]GEN20692.1 dUTP diphosphatase [Ligilactobacillus acidipiscis]HJE97704.1 dUTP diphosphatase [Ligilactobacillus acidipiscis]